MKANEAPEKIYMTPSFGEPDNILLASFSKSHLNFHRDIEYIRTDSFTEKVKEAVEIAKEETIDKIKQLLEEKYLIKSAEPLRWVSWEKVFDDLKQAIKDE